MSRTPGFIVPSSYSSQEELEKDLRRRSEEAGFTPFEFPSTEIKHFGVKGMKWGVRKAELNAPSARYSEKNRAQDKNTHGSRAVKRINKRLNKGQTLKKSRQKEVNRNRLQAASLVGAYYAVKVLNVAGPVLLDAARGGVAQKAQTNRGRAAAAATMGLPRTASTGPSYAKQKSGVYNISSL